MKAIVIHEYGGPEVLQLAERPTPPISPDQVLIAVQAAGVNPIDWRIRSGQVARHIPCEFPMISGREVSGVITEVGDAVSAFKPGDEVFCFLQQQTMHWGGYAEFVPAEANKVALKPRTFSFAEAAAVPIAAHTAWQALFEAGGLKAGDSVLIHGAAGSVASAAVQLANNAGVRVIATASPNNHAYARDLGAELVVDYNAADFAQQIIAAGIDRVNSVLAPYAGHSLRGSAPLVDEACQVVLLSPVATQEDMQIGPARTQILVAQARGEELGRIAALCDAGKLRFEVAATLPLEEAARAQEMSATQHTRGKIVLTVGN